eukprot:1391691-Amorphochlora_amoeboformis.AAC.2
MASGICGSRAKPGIRRTRRMGYPFWVILAGRCWDLRGKGRDKVACMPLVAWEGPWRAPAPAIEAERSTQGPSWATMATMVVESRRTRVMVKR